MTTIDMQTMRYINLLDRASRVKTSKCFVYNNTIIFAVPKELISKAIGPDGANVRVMREQLRKNIKIIGEPSMSPQDVARFVQDVVEPARFKSAEIVDGTLIITAGSPQNKALLFGRNKSRFAELKQIIEDIFSVELKVI